MSGFAPKRLKDLLAEAEFSLFLEDFPDGGTDDDVAGYCRTAEEIRQEARRIINWLWDEQLKWDEQFNRHDPSEYPDDEPA